MQEKFATIVSRIHWRIAEDRTYIEGIDYVSDEEVAVRRITKYAERHGMTLDALYRALSGQSCDRDAGLIRTQVGRIIERLSVAGLTNAA